MQLLVRYAMLIASLVRVSVFSGARRGKQCCSGQSEAAMNVALGTHDSTGFIPAVCNS